MRTFESGATRDDNFDKLDYEGHLSPLALERYAVYMHTHRTQSDGTRRESDQWQKGLPIKECIKSLFRHFVDLWKLGRGYETTDEKDGHFISTEEACCAIIFNAFAILHEKEKLKHKMFLTPPGVDPTAWKNAKDDDSVPYTEVCAPNIPHPVQCDNGMESRKFPPTQYGGKE